MTHNEPDSRSREMPIVRSPIPDLVVVPELQEQLPCSPTTSTGFLSSIWLAPRSSASSTCRASSITSSIFDLSTESEQLERALIENDVRVVHKFLELHPAKFTLTLSRDVHERYTCSSESRSRRPSSRYSIDVDPGHKRSPTPVDLFFDRRESVTPEADIPKIFKTALHVAIRNNSEAAVRLLLKFGLDPNAPTTNLNHHTKVAGQVIEPPKINVISSSSLSNADISTNIDCQCNKSDRLQVDNAEHGRREHGPSFGSWCGVCTDDIHVIYSQDELYNLPPLFQSVIAGKPILTHQLLIFGAEASVQDKRGNTPLHLAVCPQLFNINCARELLQFGASISLQNVNGKSAYDLHANVKSEQQALLQSILLGRSVNSLTNSIFVNQNYTESSCYSNAHSGSANNRIFRKLSKNKKVRSNGGSGIDLFHEMRERLSSASSGKSSRGKHQSVNVEELDSDGSLVSVIYF